MIRENISMYVYFTLSALLIVCGCLSVPPRSCTKAVVEEGGRKDFPLLSEVPYHDNVLIMGYKGKGHPITGHVGPVGEQRYSSTLPLTSALDGGRWSTPLSSRFTPGKDSLYPLHRKLCEPRGSSGCMRKISPPPGFDPQTAQPVTSHYTDLAIPAHDTGVYLHIFLILALDGSECNSVLLPTLVEEQMLRYRMDRMLGGFQSRSGGTC
jgi:hypothetical protein